MRTIQPADEPLAIGRRVYVLSLDVFARVLLWVGEPPRGYLVECEPPMPGFITEERVERLYLEEL